MSLNSWSHTSTTIKLARIETGEVAVGPWRHGGRPAGSNRSRSPVVVLPPLMESWSCHRIDPIFFDKKGTLGVGWAPGRSETESDAAEETEARLRIVSVNDASPRLACVAWTLTLGDEREPLGRGSEEGRRRAATLADSAGPPLPLPGRRRHPRPGTWKTRRIGGIWTPSGSSDLSVCPSVRPLAALCAPPFHLGLRVASGH
jgi:hypothetical protein